MAQDVEVYPVESLSDTVNFFNGENSIPSFKVSLKEVFSKHRQYIIDFQDVKGQAKPYQMRQFLKLVEKHNLKLEDD